MGISSVIISKVILLYAGISEDEKNSPAYIWTKHVQPLLQRFIKTRNFYLKLYF